MPARSLLRPQTAGLTVPRKRPLLPSFCRLVQKSTLPINGKQAYSPENVRRTTLPPSRMKIPPKGVFRGWADLADIGTILPPFI